MTFPSNRFDNNKILVINGPGQHLGVLLQALKTSADSFYYSNYFPEYKYIYVDKKGIETLIGKSYTFSLLEKLAGKFFRHYKTSENRLIDILFTYYDYLVCKQVNTKSVLIAWPQVSLYSIRRANELGIPVLLEYPMIHIDSWNAIMHKEYSRFGIKISSNIFSEFMTKRMRLEIQNATQINVLSSFAKQSFIEAGVPESKLSVTSLPVDAGFFTPSFEEVRSNKFVIVFVGRIDLLKGVHILLKAFSELNIQNSELWLAGDVKAEIRPFLVKYSKNVVLKGYTKDKEELKRIYQGANVLVLPSLQESFGMVLLEALSCGIPVIASKNSGGPDVVVEGKNGYIFDPNNIESLKEAIMTVYSEREKHKESKAEIRSSISEFQRFENYASKFNNILDKLKSN